jgi:hypothetical protein
MLDKIPTMKINCTYLFFLHMCTYLCMYEFVFHISTYKRRRLYINFYTVAVSKSSVPFITQGLRSTEAKILYPFRNRFLSVQPVARDRLNEGRHQ